VQNKERILKAVREMQLVTKWQADFSTETLKTGRSWNDVFQLLKENNHQPRLLYQPKV
jgi:hypothetical protein